ncbi:MAG: hypothetical protein AB1Z98_10695, partial [Nannocystaceae bacterium]
MTNHGFQDPSRRRFLLGAGALASLVALPGGCATEHELRPRTVTPGASPILTALRYGITAPSPHNTQPWLFEVRGDHEARLYFDRDRRLVFTDPPIRQGHLGHGTLLETVALAAPRFGHRARIELLPEGPMTPQTYGERPTAIIRVVPDADARPEPLADAMATRRTSRLVHEGPPITADEGRTIAADITAPDGVTIEVITDDRVAALREMAKEAMAIEVDDRELYGETLTWFRFTPEQIREQGDGLNLQTADSDTAAARMFLKPSNWHAKTNRRVYLKRFDAAVDSTTAFVTLSTDDDTMRDWIVAGQAWLRTQLAAHRHGLWMHPLSQILQEFPQMDPLRP